MVYKKNIIIKFVVLIVMLVGCSSSDKESAWLYQLPNQSYSQMMSYIIYGEHGDLIVIDGGTSEDLEYLVNQILEINGTGKISGWFVTHYHKDHTGALASYLLSQDKRLTIDKIYYQFPDEEWVKKYEENRYADIREVNQAFENYQGEKIVEKDDTFDFSDFSIEVVRNVNEEITVNAGNNSSIVYKVLSNQNNLLFLGDLGIEGGEELLSTSQNKIANMEYVQVAHHGQAGVSEEFYKVVNPKYCLWPTTEWLWDNNEKIYKTNQTKEWMEKLNVKRNYIAKDGLYKINISTDEK